MAELDEGRDRRQAFGAGRPTIVGAEPGKAVEHRSLLRTGGSRVPLGVEGAGTKGAVYRRRGRGGRPTVRSTRAMVVSRPGRGEGDGEQHRIIPAGSLPN